MEIKKCRSCKSTELKSVFELGDLCQTGVFPTSDALLEEVPVGLSFCENCKLLQMRYSYNLEEMYGDNYGYRSGLNSSMVEHLNLKVEGLLVHVAKSNLNRSHMTVLDIGSNDGTLLSFYPPHFRRIGIDPTANKFKQYYEPNIIVEPNFFSADCFEKISDNSADIITSVSMFYDLEDPIQFVRDVKNCLAEDGIWHFEQSYCRDMIEKLSYDTICHEHLEYYTLTSIKYILDEVGLKIIDIKFNDINGGSIAITASKSESKMFKEHYLLDFYLNTEIEYGLTDANLFIEFAKKCRQHAMNTRLLLCQLKSEGCNVYGYGASTKGNVLLQYAKLGHELISGIAEVNPDKFGKYTPGTNIPIFDEKNLNSLSERDYFLVLPWHFKDFILKKEAGKLRHGAQFIFPFPNITIY